MTNETLAILAVLSDDARQDMGVSPNIAAPVVLCPKCGIDITDHDDVELRAHQRLHTLLESSPRSIPSQDKQESHLWRTDRVSLTGSPLHWEPR